MRVEVLFFGRPRELAGTSKEVLSVEEGTRLSDVFGALGSRFGVAMTNELRRIEGLIVFINGRDYRTLGGADTPLKDSDTIAILPVVTGG